MLKFFVLLSVAAVAFSEVLPGPHDFINGIKDLEEGRFTEYDDNSFVVGGNTASPGQFPYQASLRSSGNAHFCGGFIANNRWIVSAAHCTVGRSLANTIVVLGAHSRTTGGTRFNSNRIVNHPNYNSNTIANDVSVVMTTATIGQTNTIRPIALGSTHVGGGVTAVLSGWGLTSSPGSLAANLQFLSKQTLTTSADLVGEDKVSITSYAVLAVSIVPVAGDTVVDISEATSAWNTPGYNTDGSVSNSKWATRVTIASTTASLVK
uniref:Peptidase S1 domain-containing protein n=1 Tax=Phlebotomus papatasi TaxID=29031 RepID=A0A1B0DMV7_PHLPP